MAEELVRARVDPVDVLDDQDDRLRLARTNKHVAEQVEGPSLELRRRQPIEKFWRSRNSEEVREQDGSFFFLEAQALKSLIDASADLLAGHPLDETEVSSQQFQNRTVGDGATIRHTSRFHHSNFAGIEPLQ